MKWKWFIQEMVSKEYREEVLMSREPLFPLYWLKTHLRLCWTLWLLEVAL